MSKMFQAHFGPRDTKMSEIWWNLGSGCVHKHGKKGTNSVPAMKDFTYLTGHVKLTNT